MRTAQMELVGSWVLGILKNWMGLFLTYQQNLTNAKIRAWVSPFDTNLLLCSFREEKGPTFTSCKSHLFSQRMVLIFGSNAIRPAGQTKTQTVSLQFGSIDIPCGASFNHNRTISNRLLKHLNLII
jgi:hypothetical protein